jgi:heat shock protein HtpX
MMLKWIIGKLNTMIMNSIKTVLLLGFLTGMFVWTGYGIGGQNGIWGAVIFALIFNSFIYFNAAKLMLNMTQSQPVDPNQHAELIKTISILSSKLNIPTPQLYIVPTEKLNAFATGRNPSKSAVALTKGMLDHLSDEELEGVLAHELSHIKYRDILIGTIATFLATIIGYVGNQLRYNPEAVKDHRRNPISLLIMTIFMPLAAILIRLSISRTREYAADTSAAYLTKKPLELASALQKIHNLNKSNPFKIFSWSWAIIGAICIEQPTFSEKIRALLNTHPPVNERVANLQRIYKEMFQKNN